MWVAVLLDALFDREGTSEAAKALAIQLGLQLSKVPDPRPVLDVRAGGTVPVRLPHSTTLMHAAVVGMNTTSWGVGLDRHLQVRLELEVFEQRAEFDPGAK